MISKNIIENNCVCLQKEGIFLFQMCYFVFGKRFISGYDTSFYHIVYILVSIIICIVPIVFIKKHLICNINKKFKLWN